MSELRPLVSGSTGAPGEGQLMSGHCLRGKPQLADTDGHLRHASGAQRWLLWKMTFPPGISRSGTSVVKPLNTLHSYPQVGKGPLLLGFHHTPHTFLDPMFACHCPHGVASFLGARLVCQLS